MFFKKWQIKRLSCPTCGGEIVALPGDRAFACGQCELGFEIVEGQVRHLSANQVYRGWWLRTRPGGPSGEGRGRFILLPFWRFELTAPADPFTMKDTSRLPPTIRKQVRDDERFDLSRHRIFVYYPAFHTTRPMTAFDLAAALTDAQPSYELSAGAYSAGAVHSSVGTERRLHSATEHLADRSPGLALAGLCSHHSPQLVSLPFERRGSELVEGISGATLPAGELNEPLLELNLNYPPPRNAEDEDS